jgi:tetratricopeptide (TPR) repeat protein
VYNGLVKSERELIHKKIGDVIEILFQDRLTEFYDVLAFHFVRAGKTLKAVEFLVKSGEKSLKLFSLDESDLCFSSAYKILSGLQKMTVTENTALIDLLNSWALVYYYRGDFKQLAEILSQHEELASEILDDNIASIYYAWQGFAAWWTDNFEHSKAFLDKALDLSKKSENIESKGYALTWLSWLYVELGEFENAINAGMEGNKIAILKNNHYLYFKSLGAISRCNFYRGVSKECISIGRQLIVYGQKFSNIRCQVMGYWNESEGYIASGDYALAVKTYKEAHKIAEDPFFKNGTQAFLIMSYVMNEETLKAKEILEKIKKYFIEYGNEHVIKIIPIFEGVILIDQGYFSKGLNLILNQKEELNKIGRKGFLPIVELILGNIFLVIVQRRKPINLGDIIKNIDFIMKYAFIAGRKAEHHFLRAIDLSAELGSIGIMGQAKLGLGILYKKKKEYTKANRFLKESIEIFKDIGATCFEEQASVEIQTLP